MSYSRTIHESIHVHYSETVNWGKTETGGSRTVVFDDYVPVNIYLNVDTNPFDRSIRSCRSSVDFLTGAVVAANTAEVASISAGANKIADHVVGGFFNMIKSELSQNMASLYSKFNAIHELMVDRHKTLENVRNIMESDYERTRRRYFTIFNDLDVELQRRIIALDKSAYEFGEKVKAEMLYKDTGNSFVNFVTRMNEDEIVNQQLLLAQNHSRVKNVISDLGNHVLQEEIYSKKMKSVIRENPSQASADEYVPVLFLESDDITQPGLKNNGCYAGDIPGNSSGKVADCVSAYFTSQPEGWHDIESDEKKSLDDAFNAIAEKDLSESISSGETNAERIYQTIMMLKNQGNTLVI